MKIDFKENALKLTIGGNMFAMSGLVFFFFNMIIDLLWNYLATSSSNFSLEVRAALLTAGGFFLHFVLTILSILILAFELLKKRRLKNTFFKENKLYNWLFYIGLVLNLVIILYYTKLFLGV